MASRSESVFRLGRPSASEGVADRAAQDTMFATFCYKCLRRHANGDWGNISAEDKTRNRRAIEEGSRILSAYRRKGCPEIWVVTEADRVATKILLPHEYQGEPCQSTSTPKRRLHVSLSCAGEMHQSKEDSTSLCRPHHR